MPTATTTLTITINPPDAPDRDSLCPLAPALHHGPLRTPRNGVAVAVGIIG